MTLFLLLVIDNGHVYTTFLRSLYEPNKFTDHLKKYYLFIFFFISIGVVIHFTSPLFLWRFAFYATVFHYIKQNIGILKLLMAKDDKKDSKSIYTLYILQLIAVFGIHLKPDAKIEYYSPNDIWNFDNEVLFNYTIILYSIIVLFYLFYLCQQLKLNKELFPGHFFVLVTAILFSLYSISGLNLNHYLLALIASHGIPYMFLIKGKLKSRIPYLNIITVFAVALVFGLLENYYEDNFINFSNETSKSLMNSLLSTLLLVPLFSHFFFDTYIWKRDLKEELLTD